ncbi:MAG: hypothetical protein QW512_06760 [Thermofilaceae archaeon]
MRAMAMVLARLRRRRRARSISAWLRGKAIGLIFVALAPLIIAVGSFIVSVVPDMYVYVSGGAIGVGSTLPTGATGVSVKLVLGVLTWFLGIAVFLTGMRHLGVRL